MNKYINLSHLVKSMRDSLRIAFANPVFKVPSFDRFIIYGEKRSHYRTKDVFPKIPLVKIPITIIITIESAKHRDHVSDY